MKLTKQVITAISMAMVFNMALAAQPFMGERMGHDPMQGPMMEPPLTHIYIMLKAKQKDFNITDNQLEQVKNLVFTLEEKVISFESKNRLNHLELKKLLMNEKKDYEKISSVLSKISDNHQTIFIEQLKTRDAIDSILTPQQHDAIKEEMKNRFKNRDFPPGGRRGMMHKERGFVLRGDSQDFDFNDDWE